MIKIKHIIYTIVLMAVGYLAVQFYEFKKESDNAQRYITQAQLVTLYNSNMVESVKIDTYNKEVEVSLYNNYKAVLPDLTRTEQPQAILKIASVQSFKELADKEGIKY